MIASATEEVCDKMRKLFQLPTVFHAWFAYTFTEQGEFTEAMKADICAIDCGDSNNEENPNMPSPTGVSATDGGHSDKVVVTWNAVTAPSGVAAVTEYKIYRSLSSNTDPDEADLITTITAPTLQYEDTDVVVGTTYNYWVVATNGSDSSNFGGPDVGHASTPTVTLAAVSDLKCTKGFSYLGSSGTVRLAWTPPAGAEKYDVYRNTVSDYATAMKIGSDKTPVSTAFGVVGVSNGTIIDNVTSILYYDMPPSNSVIYYYWVVAKKSAPPATSLESNTDTGWVTIGSDLASTAARGGFVSATPVVVPVGCNTAKVVLGAGGGGGAGGSETYGGGGGGGGATIVATLTVVPGDILEMNGIGGTIANAPSATNGDAGPSSEITLNGVQILLCAGGSGGVFNSSGAGAGGAGGAASGTVALTGHTGADGLAAAGVKGGQGGHAFGSPRGQIAHSASVAGPDGDATGPGMGGGGSYADAAFASQMTGGAGGSSVFGIYAIGVA